MFEAETATEQPAEAEATAKRPGLPLEPRRMLGAARAAIRPVLVLSVVGAIVGAGLAKGVVKQEFDAHVVVEWTPYPGAELDAQRQLHTVADTVKLPENLEAVRSDLDLPMTLQQIGGAVSVDVAKKGQLLTLRASADDPERAERMANALAERLVTSRKEQRRSDLEQREKRAAEAVKRAQKDVKLAREALDRFRRKHGIADLEVQRRLVLEQATQLAAEAKLARSDALAERARGNALRKLARRTPKKVVSSENEYRPAAKQLAEVQVELDRAKSRLTDAHPTVRGLEAEAAALKLERNRKVRVERVIAQNPRWSTLQTELTTSEAERAAAESKHDTLSISADDAREELSKLTGLETKLASLELAVKVNEKHLSEVAADLATSADAADAPTADVSVLSPAKRPNLPARSKRKVVAAGMVVLFAALGLIAAFVRELWRLRVKTPREAGFWLGAPVIGATRWPGGESPDALLAELAGAVSEADGTTLVVATRSADADSARELATKLAASKRDAGDGCATDAVRSWDGELEGTALRAAARASDRVVLVVHAGADSMLELAQWKDRLGRSDGIAAIVIGAGPELAVIPDRTGQPARFWSASAGATA